ncbi:MAG: outer membrane lipoprotein-sorting protein [Kangiellaceae bacterium]|nr:outer membrane lipoprotein-sorting protein [Kangiellaceae bacterium]
MSNQFRFLLMLNLCLSLQTVAAEPGLGLDKASQETPAKVIREAKIQTVENRLQQADSYRFSLSPTKTVTYVHEYEQEKLEKTQVYEVFTKPGKGSLAVFKSASQAGQKVLMQDEKFWIFMPKTRRPIRISPMQKLLGDAAVGDLTTLSWSESYSAEFVESKVEREAKESDEIELRLTAKIKGVSYQKIDLVVNSETNFPIRAKFYLKSGKLAKVANFIRGELNEKFWVTEMILENSVVGSRKTVMQTVSAETVDIPDKFFNPSFLIRNNLGNL